MIEQIIIDGYKSIRHATISIQPLNLLTGLNSSGKSSLIQSIRILDRLARKKDPVLPEESGDEKDIRNIFEPSLEIKAIYGIEGEYTITYSHRSEDNSSFPKVIYVGVDRLGPSIYYKSLPNNDMDPQGHNVLKCIEYYSSQPDPLPEILVPEECEGEGFRFVVQGWLKQISPGVKFNIEKISGTDAYRATYNDFSPYNVGYGLSYSLSIIVAVLMGVQQKNSIVLLENPEAHIHAKGQVAFADLICRAVEAGAQIVVETHSDHVFDGVRIYAKEHKGFCDKTNILWFRLVKENGLSANSYSTVIDHPILTDDGTLDFWPVDMFSQFMDNAERLF